MNCSEDKLFRIKDLNDENLTKLLQMTKIIFSKVNNFNLSFDLLSNIEHVWKIARGERKFIKLNDRRKTFEENLFSINNLKNARKLLLTEDFEFQEFMSQKVKVVNLVNYALESIVFLAELRWKAYQKSIITLHEALFLSSFPNEKKIVCSDC